MFMKYRIPCTAALAASLAVMAAGAVASGANAVDVTNAWVRATVPGQSVAGVYMDITASAPRALVAVSSPVAGRAELHTMTMDGGVMKMRALERIDLPARVTVKLAPGGHHIMLVGIKRKLNAGERVPITITVRDLRGARSMVAVDAEVRAGSGARGKHH